MQILQLTVMIDVVFNKVDFLVRSSVFCISSMALLLWIKICVFLLDVDFFLTVLIQQCNEYPFLFLADGLLLDASCQIWTQSHCPSFLPQVFE